MRICKHLTCDRPADVWLNGPKCAAHAMAEPQWTQAMNVPVTLPTGTAALPVAATPGPEGGEGQGQPPSLTAPVLFDDDLVAFLERVGWDEIDLELALISRLEELS